MVWCLGCPNIGGFPSWYISTTIDLGLLSWNIQHPAWTFLFDSISLLLFEIQKPELYAMLSIGENRCAIIKWWPSLAISSASDKYAPRGALLGSRLVRILHRLYGESSTADASNLSLSYCEINNLKIVRIISSNAILITVKHDWCNSDSLGYGTSP